MEQGPFYHKYFMKCSKFNILFSGNHVLPLKLNIPRFYTDVYNLYIENFKKRTFNYSRNIESIIVV